MAQVSVIVPSFNHAPYLEERIESILLQSFSDFELILLDDCSTDHSREILARYSNHPKVSNCVLNDANSGSTFRQWERGLSCATGEYVWIAESDDVAAPEFLAILSGVLDAHPAVGLAYCQSLRINARGITLGSWKDQTEGVPNSPWGDSFTADGLAMLRSFFLFENVVPNASAVLFRRRCLEPKVLAQASSYTINGDWYVWCNILWHAKLAFVNQHLNSCRFHEQKGSSRNVLNFNNIAEFYRLRGFLYSVLALTEAERDRLNDGLFSLWTHQRQSLGVSRDAPETLKVLAEAEAVDPKVRERLQAATV